MEIRPVRWRESRSSDDRSPRLELAAVVAHFGRRNFPAGSWNLQPNPQSGLVEPMLPDECSGGSALLVPYPRIYSMRYSGRLIYACESRHSLLA